MGVMAMLLAAVQSTSRNHRIGATFIAAGRKEGVRDKNKKAGA
jgi:hypothetical protein